MEEEAQVQEEQTQGQQEADKKAAQEQEDAQNPADREQEDEHDAVERWQRVKKAEAKAKNTKKVLPAQSPQVQRRPPEPPQPRENGKEECRRRNAGKQNVSCGRKKEQSRQWKYRQRVPKEMLKKQEKKEERTQRRKVRFRRCFLHQHHHHWM